MDSPTRASYLQNLEDEMLEMENPPEDADALPEAVRPSVMSDVKSVDLALPLPRSSLDSSRSLQIKRTDNALVETLINSLRDIDTVIAKRIEMIEGLDISIHISTFKVYEATHEFKLKIGEIKDERNRILVSVENKSELSFILHDLDRQITELEQELELKITNMNKQKIEFQEEIEDIITQLDADLVTMKTEVQNLQGAIDVEKGVAYRSQIMLINERYTPAQEEFETHLLNYEKLQMTGWRFEHSEIKLSELLEDQGLKFTPSGRLLTRTGSLITFQEAQDKGYFNDVNMSLERIFEFFKERDREQERARAQEQAAVPDSTIYSEEGSSVESRMSSEDVKYLKQYVGKPLTLALAEITAVQPRDPIHYLGHYLFKYRYNQDLEEIRKQEIDELTNERKIIAMATWKKFVEEEARNAVLEMILRAEEIAYQNELRRIEQEQLLMAEEEEEGEEHEYENKELIEEAKDKFN